MAGISNYSEGSDRSRKATSTVGPTHAGAMVIFRAKHIFDKLQRDGAKINIGLNESVIHSSASVRFKELLFELQVADGHELIPFMGMSAGRMFRRVEGFCDSQNAVNLSKTVSASFKGCRSRGASS